MNIPFERELPVAIDEALCQRYNVALDPEVLVQEIEDLYEEVTDSDNETFAKPIFEVKRNQPRPMTTEERVQAARPRRVRQFVEWPARDEGDATARPRMRTVGLRR